MFPAPYSLDINTIFKWLTIANHDIAGFRSPSNSTFAQSSFKAFAFDVDLPSLKDIVFVDFISVPSIADRVI